MPSMGGGDSVVGSKRRTRSNGDGFFSGIQVDKTRKFAALEQDRKFLFESADADHVP